MDYNKPWGWQPQKVVAPMGNTVAPLSASAASMPENVVLPESLGKRMTRDVGSAVAMKALDNAMAPSDAATSAAQDSATKAALFGDVGYGAPMGAAAGEAATEVASEAATDVAADVATDAATDVAADAAASGVAAAVPFAGALKSLAEGNYVQTGAQVAGTVVAGPLGGLAAKYATKALGFSNGTTSVPAPLSSADRSAARMAAGARYAPELFTAVNAPATGRPSIPAIPDRATAAGGKGAAVLNAAQAAQPRQSIVARPAPAPAPAMQMPFRPFYNPMYDNVEVGGA